MNIKYIIKQFIKMFFQHILLPVIYAFYSKKGINEDIIVFADCHNNKIPESMKYLNEEIKKTDFQVVEKFCDYSSLSSLQSLKSMVEFMKVYASAKYVIICDNFLPVASCNKNKKTKVIQLWHGCGAFKKFGYDTKDDIPKYYKGNVFKNIDLVTVSSKECIQYFSTAMNLPHNVFCDIGISRTDKYYSNDYNEKCRLNFYDRYPEAIGKKIVLWAPTFRSGFNSNANEYMKYLSDLKKQLGNDWFIIVKLHPHLKEEIDGDYCNIGTEELLPVSDLLITDYSSILFDFTIFNKPIVFFAPDLNEYEDKRGFYLEYGNLPGSIVKDIEKLGPTILSEYEENNLQKRVEFGKIYMNKCDGNATNRILDYIKKNVD